MPTATKTFKQLAKKVKITTEYGQIKQPWEKLDEWQKKAHNYRCQLRYQGRSYSFDFFMGPALADEPDAEGCLDCLLSDANSGVMDFEEFCAEMGFDQDSRKAEKLHKSCQKTAAAMHRLLGDDFEIFLYAERN